MKGRPSTLYGLIQGEGGQVTARPVAPGTPAMTRWRTASEGLALVSEVRDHCMGHGLTGKISVYGLDGGGTLTLTGSVTLEKAGA